MVQDFGDKTEDDLMADTAFTASLTTGLVDAVSAALEAFAGKIDASSILLEKFLLSDPARRLLGLVWVAANWQGLSCFWFF